MTHLARHEHFCQVLPTLTSDVSIVDNTLPPVPPPSTAAEPIPLYSSTVQLDPDHILPKTNRAAFQQLLHSYDSVFDPSISGWRCGSFRSHRQHEPSPTAPTEESSPPVFSQQISSAAGKV